MIKLIKNVITKTSLLISEELSLKKGIDVKKPPVTEAKMAIIKDK